jgi:ribosomal protein S18 acetylase RimI-like enzyme
VNVRPATAADEQVLRELWAEFETEVPEPDGFVPETWEGEWAQLQQEMATGCVLLAEDDDGPVGFLEARRADSGRWHVETVQVRERARRQGVATALVRECSRAARAGGMSNLSLDVLVSNTLAEAMWRRLGFEPVALLLAQSLDQLDGHLGDAPTGPSRASTHVQTDDRPAVERAVAQFVPRLDGVDVRDADGGWIRIADPLFDSDRDAQARFARDLSDRLGAVVVALALERGAVVRFRLYERGRMVDEYLSVPDFYAQLNRGDELAMEANPTLVARLTGADREEVRRVARTAASPAELPPAEALYEDVARMMGLEP